MRFPRLTIHVDPNSRRGKFLRWARVPNGVTGCQAVWAVAAAPGRRLNKTTEAIRSSPEDTAPLWFFVLIVGAALGFLTFGGFFAWLAWVFSTSFVTPFGEFWSRIIGLAVWIAIAIIGSKFINLLIFLGKLVAKYLCPFRIEQNG